MKGTFAAVVAVLALVLLATTARHQNAESRRAWRASALRRGGFGPMRQPV